MRLGRQGTEAELAYCAGIVDGEGCISAFEDGSYAKDGKKWRKPTDVRWRYKVHVKMVDPESVNLLLEIFGGSIYMQKPRSRGNFWQYTWTVSEQRAVAMVKQILPYLRIKKARAHLLIQLGESAQKYHHAGRGVRVSEEEKTHRRNLVSQIKDQNQRMHLRPEGTVRKDLVQ